jgi:hypothetical protein
MPRVSTVDGVHDYQLDEWVSVTIEVRVEYGRWRIRN